MFDWLTNTDWNILQTALINERYSLDSNNMFTTLILCVLKVQEIYENKPLLCSEIYLLKHYIMVKAYSIVLVPICCENILNIAFRHTQFEVNNLFRAAVVIFPCYVFFVIFRKQLTSLKSPLNSFTVATNFECYIST